EQFLELASTLMPHGVRLDKIAPMVQRLYAKWGIGIDKQRREEIDAPVGRVILRLLCSLARRGRALRTVQQAGDGCVFEAVLPSDLFSLRGVLVVPVRRHEAKTDVTAATKIAGQYFDWGKSRRCLTELFGDLQADAA